MQISELAISKIRGNNKAINALGYAFDRGYKTIENWLEGRNIILTTPTAVEIIKKETGLTDKEILTKSEAKATA